MELKSKKGFTLKYYLIIIPSSLSALFFGMGFGFLALKSQIAFVIWISCIVLLCYELLLFIQIIHKPIGWGQLTFEKERPTYFGI